MLAQIVDDAEIEPGLGFAKGTAGANSESQLRPLGQADCFICYPLYSTMSKITIFESGSRSGDGSNSFYQNFLPLYATYTVKEWVCLVIRIVFKIHLRQDF